MTGVDRVAALEVGGTHATGAWVDRRTWQVAADRRVSLDSHGNAAQILDAMAAAGTDLDAAAGTVWGVAMPDPFDYVRGIGRFHGVAKFEALDGVDVRAGLAERLPGPPGDLVFCNDADAFTVGEWVAGAATGRDRVVGLTLGTGVGSGWVAGGRIVDPGVPRDGRAHHLHVDGAPLEESMSRRAIRRAYARATGDDKADVREICERAGDGDRTAHDVLAHALHALGRAIAGPIQAFGADVVVVGGSMSRSWPLFEPWFRDGAGEAADDAAVPTVVVAADPDGAPLVGAAYVAAQRATDRA